MSQTVRLMLVYMFYFDCGSEAVTRWCSVKMEFLKILQNSPENTWEAWEACNFIKKETLAQVFPVNFAKSLRTPPSAASLIYITQRTEILVTLASAN